jgi:hypothetical protein
MEKDLTLTPDGWESPIDFLISLLPQDLNPTD